MLQKPNSCFGCPIHHISHGFSQPVGTGEKGVLVVAEALGEQEAAAGQALVGKAGHYLFNALKRVGIEREDLALHNVLSCRPPDNKLAGAPYEAAAISHCSPNLDRAINHYRQVAAAHGRTFVIVTLGRIAFKRILRLDDRRHERLLKNDYLCYPFWSEEYGAWVIAADHPAYLMRGNHHLLSILQFAFQRAMEIAEQGFSYQEDNYLLDPPAAQFDAWVTTYLAALQANPDETFLSYDIETPYKSGADEEEVAKDVDDDRTILRCAFAFQPGRAVTVPWRSEYMPALRRVFSQGRNFVGWNSNNYDDPRVHAQTPMSSISIDAMLAWHVLNSALPKGLGFVTPFYAQRSAMWKHLAEAEPAFYNAKDADMALQNWLGIRRDLAQGRLAKVFNRHVIEVNRLFGYMRDTGVTIDLEARAQAEADLTRTLNSIEERIQSVIPDAARTLKIYKKTPKSTGGLVEVSGIRTTRRCSVCGLLDVKVGHYKSIGVKRLKSGDPENPCIGGRSEKVDLPATLWALPEPFKLSNVSLQRYQKVVKHLPIIDPKRKAITFDDKAMLRLKKQHPKDPLYPLVGEFRKHQKLLSTYIGVTQDDKSVRGGLENINGIIRPNFTHNPSTLRSACQNPNLQNLPRPGGKDDPATLIRNLVRARDGHVFRARDYSGIEAVLVGYFAHDRGYIRLAKQDVHSFYTAYALHALDGRIGANDLPLLSWDDDRLFSRLADIKREFKHDRNTLYKHLVHGANFMQGAKGAAEKILSETGIEYPVALVKRVMDIYFELFPAIKTWHRTILAQADRDGHVTNPFGYVHRFHRAYEWEKIGNEWQKTPGPDANKIIAFLPQSTAAGIIKEAMLRLFQNRFDEAGQYLRLLIHDEIFCEVPTHLVDVVDAAMQVEMERPILEMPLPPEWGMGSHLVILTEAKQGERWGLMH